MLDESKGIAEMTINLVTHSYCSSYYTPCGQLAHYDTNSSLEIHSVARKHKILTSCVQIRVYKCAFFVKKNLPVQTITVAATNSKSTLVHTDNSFIIDVPLKSMINF